MMRLGPGAPAPALLLASFLALLTVVVLTASARAQTAFISNEKDKHRLDDRREDAEGC